MKTQETILHDKRHGLIVPMSKTKIDAFFEEFPWLNDFVSDRYDKSFYVSRVEPALLEYRPIKRDISPWPLRAEWVYEHLRFLDKKGGLTSLRFLETITIGEQIDRFSKEIAKKISYILSDFSYTKAVIIYKSPKGFSIPAWIEMLVAQEKAKIHAEVESIDAEGENLSIK